LVLKGKALTGIYGGKRRSWSYRGKRYQGYTEGRGEAAPKRKALTVIYGGKREGWS